jgi:hypothetical protein
LSFFSINITDILVRKGHAWGIQSGINTLNGE